MGERTRDVDVTLDLSTARRFQPRAVSLLFMKDQPHNWFDGFDDP